jgi:hypothetical protein
MDLVTPPGRFEVWLVNLDDDEADAAATVLVASLRGAEAPGWSAQGLRAIA